MTDLLSYARYKVGVRMGSFHGETHIGYTADATKAARLREAGARVAQVKSTSTDGPTVWEIAFSPDAEVVGTDA